MPKQAIELFKPDAVLDGTDIAVFLKNLIAGNK